MLKGKLKIFIVLLQKYEKLKFVQCLVFLGNGDVFIGDLGGVIFIWSKIIVEFIFGKGFKGIVFLDLSYFF